MGCRFDSLGLQSAAHIITLLGLWAVGPYLWIFFYFFLLLLLSQRVSLFHSKQSTAACSQIVPTIFLIPFVHPSDDLTLRRVVDGLQFMVQRSLVLFAIYILLSCRTLRMLSINDFRLPSRPLIGHSISEPNFNPNLFSDAFFRYVSTGRTHVWTLSVSDCYSFCFWKLSWVN